MPRAKNSFTAGTLLVSLPLVMAALMATPAPALADQFVLFDAKFTFTKADADNGVPNKSHYYVSSTNPDANWNPAQPTNWVAPVDYRNGIVHIRTEVIEKPAGGEGTQWWLCYIAKRGVPGTDGYGCVTTGVYKEQGVYDREEAMTSWWNNTAIDWTQGIKQVDMVMKDGNGDGQYTHLRPDPEHFFPTRMRVTVIQVSKGSTYDPSLVPGLPVSSADGGPLDAADAATNGDAPSESAIESGTTLTGGSGTGGATGTGGAIGSGGFSGAAGTGGGVASGGTGGGAGTNPGRSGGAGEMPIGPAPTDSTAGCAIAVDHGTRRGRIGGVAFVVALLFAFSKRSTRGTSTS